MSVNRIKKSWLFQALVGGLLTLGVIAAFTGTGQAEENKTVTLENPRSSPGLVVGEGDTVYQYAPTVMKEGNTYRMWWCAQSASGSVAGDDILYAESNNLDGPFHAPGSSEPFRIVFEGRGDGSFDGQHTCDPSVVKVDDIYYMYYGAAIDDGQTTIGLAVSQDGLAWTRVGNDQPIITPAKQQVTGSTYGAGQPSVVYLNGKFHIIFTDTTAAGALPSNGAGQFAWRSEDPTFKADVEVATAEGWKPRTEANSRAFSVANAFSADWQYSDELKAFIIAHHNDAGKTNLTFLDAKNLANRPYDMTSFNTTWVEGPGLVSREDKHAIASAECGRVPVDVIHATGGQPTAGDPPKHLRHYGIDVVDTGVCPTPSPTPTGSETTSPSPSPSVTVSPSPSASEPSPTQSTAPTTVVPSTSPVGNGDDDLPVTGSPAFLGAVAGLVLLGSGAGLYVMARRRRANAA